MTDDSVQVSTFNCKHLDRYMDPNGTVGYCCDCGITIHKGEGPLDQCNHPNLYTSDNGMSICKDCNQQFEIFSKEAEWRYYESTGSAKDPARCHQSKCDSKNLKATFEKYHIDVPDAIRHQVEKDFEVISNNRTYRSNNRCSYIATCLFYAYIKFGQCRTSDYIRSMFHLTRREMSKKIKEYQDVFQDSRSIDIKPMDLVPWIFTLIGLPMEPHYEKVVRLLKHLSNGSEMINRSTAQSVANAAVYFYLCCHPSIKSELGLTKGIFAKKVHLSEITVTKLVKEIAKITKIDVVYK